MTDLECDLVSLARTAVRSGDRESRRFVSSLRLKHKGSMLGEHLTGVCVMAGLPVDFEAMQAQSLAVKQPLVLMRVEVLTQLEHAAAHSAELMGKYKSAFDGVTTNGGSVFAEQILKKLASEGHTDAARMLARMVELDTRSTYAAAGRRVLQWIDLEMGVSEGSGYEPAA